MLLVLIRSASHGDKKNQHFWTEKSILSRAMIFILQIFLFSKHNHTVKPLLCKHLWESQKLAT